MDKLVAANSGRQTGSLDRGEQMAAEAAFRSEMEMQMALASQAAAQGLENSQGGESSGWTRAGGALKMVGGALETLAGGALTTTGVALSEIGIGIPIAAVGVFVTAHGVDTTVSGARTLASGKEADTLTSQGLQELGMSRTAANLTDAGISVVGTLGPGTVARSPAVASALEKVARSETSVSLAYRAGTPAHNAVGVNTGSGTRWTHLRPANSEVGIKDVTLTGDAVIGPLPPPAIARYFSSVTVPVSAARADQAAQVATRALTGPAGHYNIVSRGCATHARDILKEAGVRTLPLASPWLNYAATAAQSPEVLRAAQPAFSTLSTAATGVNVVVGVEEAIAK